MDHLARFLESISPCRLVRVNSGISGSASPIFPISALFGATDELEAGDLTYQSLQNIGHNVRSSIGNVPCGGASLFPARAGPWLAVAGLHREVAQSCALWGHGKTGRERAKEPNTEKLAAYCSHRVRGLFLFTRLLRVSRPHCPLYVAGGTYGAV
jgi:hypothetical protein